MTYKSTRNYLNQQKQTFETSNELGIPEIQPFTDEYEEVEWIPFNYAMSEKDRHNKGCHFYLDDYQFERLWNNPERYVEILREFKYVLTPDFSLFTDFPKAINMYNHFRKHWVAAYLQERGVNIIPTICWADRDSFEYCFVGEPENGIVSVSSTGVNMSPKTKEKFMAGYEEMIIRLNPKMVLFFGKPIITEYYELVPNNVVFVEDRMSKRLKEMSMRKDVK